jgi:hypothetical protein
MTTTDASDITLRNAPRTDTLAQAARLFFSRGSPRLIGSLALAAWAFRLWLGAWSVPDAVAALVVLAWWPFQEWLIHVHLLHWRPKKFLGITVDPAVSKKHRAHHLDPWNLSILLVPLRSTLTTVPLLSLFLWAVLPSLQLMFTVLAVFLTLALNYEWHHYLVHTRYVPRSEWYRAIWRHHRLHHCKNEERWFGVSMLLADRVLGTAPAPSDVATSPTCRTLGYS